MWHLHSNTLKCVFPVADDISQVFLEIFNNSEQSFSKSSTMLSARNSRCCIRIKFCHWLQMYQSINFCPRKTIDFDACHSESFCDPSRSILFILIEMLRILKFRVTKLTKVCDLFSATDCRYILSSWSASTVMLLELVVRTSSTIKMIFIRFGVDLWFEWADCNNVENKWLWVKMQCVVQVKLLENAHVCCLSERITDFQFLLATGVISGLRGFVCPASSESTGSVQRCSLILHGSFCAKCENLWRWEV